MTKKTISVAENDVLMEMAASLRPDNYSTMSDDEKTYYFTLRYGEFLEQFLAGKLSFVDKGNADTMLDKALAKKR